LRLIGGHSARLVREAELAGRRVGIGCPEVGGVRAWTANRAIAEIPEIALDIMMMMMM